jgi:phosphatidylglycerol---prolipoprotein diacylglyceryl transferase
MCIQGFVLGAIVTMIIGAELVGLPVGRLLDVTAPGLLLGMTVGRFGCYFGGCCAGRPTASRWGLWSSDRRVGVRRIPTQLLESLLAVSLGLAALLAVWTRTPHPAGVVFIGAIVGYTLGRQLLFPLRDQPRYSVHGRNRMIALTGTVIAADIAMAVFA